MKSSDTKNTGEGDILSIAIETSSRSGGVAAGSGDQLIAWAEFDSNRRGAVQVVGQLDELLASRGKTPDQIRQVYVSIGPGSFTGIRVGVTVARTIAQSLPAVQCVGVPTAQVVAENARDLDWQYLAVLLSAKRGEVYSTLFEKVQDKITLARDGEVCTIEELLAQAPGHLTITGDAIDFIEMPTAGHFTVLDNSYHYPRAENLWYVGKRLAEQGNFTAPQKLLPLYGRISEAQRLWEIRTTK